MFAGRTGSSVDSKRRAILRFDLEQIPKKAKIDSVAVQLHLSNSSSDAETVSLFRLFDHWGEGSSVVEGGGSSGVPAVDGDATWLFNYFNTSTWSTEGSDYSATPSGAADVDAIGFHIWSSQQMILDVQDWVNRPETNFGWLLRGNEEVDRTRKRFDTRERSIPENRPQLIVTFTPLPSVPSLSQWGLVLLALLLVVIAAMRLGIASRRASIE